MKSKRLFIVIVCFVFFCSWLIVDQSLINKAAWVIGTWETKTQRGIVYETWTKVSDVEFMGMNYTLKDSDTAVMENIQLIQKQNSLFYIPTVKNQNNNLPVSFSLKTISDNQLVFENAKHFFPQIISYRRVRDDSLVAEISGIINGRERKQAFPMRRIK
ncbi:MAG: DUF6265 family protein [Chitinophagaceae bacterium]